MQEQGNPALSAWLAEVLRFNTRKGTTITLPSGKEAFVEWDGECLLAYTYDENEQPIYHARIRPVQETD